MRDIDLPASCCDGGGNDAPKSAEIEASASPVAEAAAAALQAGAPVFDATVSDTDSSWVSGLLSST